MGGAAPHDPPADNVGAARRQPPVPGGSLASSLPPRPPAIFAFEHVAVRYGELTALADVDGAVAAQGVTVIAGPSGSGKSTLLRLCNRLEVVSSGRVLYKGADVLGLDPLGLRRRVGMVFQRPMPFRGTVLENLRVADPGLDTGAACGFLARVDLDDSFSDREATELSGGEAQRVCLARTLVTRPEVLLMDEPTSSLDPGSTLVLEELARTLAAGGVPVVWVTHDVVQLRRLADRVVVLLDGVIRYAGPVAELSTADAKVKRFLSGERTGER